MRGIKRFFCFLVIGALVAGGVRFGGTVAYAEDAVDSVRASEGEDTQETVDEQTEGISLDGQEDSQEEDPALTEDVSSSTEITSEGEGTLSKEEAAAEESSTETETEPEDEESAEKEAESEEEESAEKEEEASEKEELSSKEEDPVKEDSNTEDQADQTGEDTADKENDIITVEIGNAGSNQSGDDTDRKALTINIGDVQMPIGMPSPGQTFDSDVQLSADGEEPDENTEMYVLTIRIPGFFSEVFEKHSYEGYELGDDGYYTKEIEVAKDEKIIDCLPKAKEFSVKDGCGLRWVTGNTTIDGSMTMSEDTRALLIPKKGHQPENVDAEEATCTKPGHGEGSVCGLCDRTLKGLEEIDSLGHDESGDWRSDEDNHYKECERCGDEILREKHSLERQEDNSWVCAVCSLDAIVAHDHDVTNKNWMHTEKQPATCDAAGVEEYWYCRSCDLYFADEKGEKEVRLEDLEIPKLEEHTVKDEWESDADRHWKTCQVCGIKTAETKHTDPVRQKDNSWICTVCDRMLKEAHTHGDEKEGFWQHIKAQAATAEAAGVKEHWFCELCDLYFADASGNTVIEQSETEIPKLEDNDRPQKPENPEKPQDPDNDDKKPSNGGGSSSGKHNGSGSSSSGGSSDAADSGAAAEAAAVSAAVGTGSPQTSDSSQSHIWLAILLLSLTGIAVSMRVIRRS